jgi:uncharacterized protein (TIGR03089 family)
VSRARTFPDLLAERLRHDPAQPLLTAYDDRTGERTELSVTTYGNWVSKTANLLVDELGLDDGDVVLLGLPSHWLVPVFLGAAWSAGLAVTTDPEVEHAVVVRGPVGAGHDGAPQGLGGAEVIACSLLPFAVRFPDALPPGVIDFGLAWPGQSDVFAPVQAPTPETPAWVGPDLSHGDLLQRADEADLPAGSRVLTDVHPAADAGVPAFLAPMVRAGSVVLVRDPDEERWPARHRDERATVGLRAADQPPSV